MFHTLATMASDIVSWMYKRTRFGRLSEIRNPFGRVPGMRIVGFWTLY